MDAFNKILKSWWVIFSVLIIFNGLGFIYIGLKNNNKNWILEGVIYEIPWLFSIIFFDLNPAFNVLFAIAMVFTLVSIVRSIWVAIKLCDVYDNEDKYAVQSTRLNNPNIPQNNSDFPTTIVCVGCLILIFILFAVIALTG